jgi:hypothetical protein
MIASHSCTATTLVASIFALILAASPLPLAVPPVQAGEEVTIDGRLHIRNPTDPPAGIEHWYLEEEWCVGCSDSDLLLGLPTRVALDARGHLHILDAQLNQVHIFSVAGEHLATHFREGEGPGEIRNPSDLVVWPDGSMGVLQEFPGQVIRVDSNGDPLSILHPGADPEAGGWSILMSGRVRGDQIVICGQMTREDENGERIKRQYLASFAPDGKEQLAYLEITEPHLPRAGKMRETDLVRPHLLGYDVGPDGRVYLTMDWDRYELWVFNPGGGIDRIIEREYEPRRRSEAERKYILDMFGAGGGGPGDAMELAENAPTIAFFQRGVQVTDTGELWILTSRGNHALPDGVLARFDIFDDQGHFQRQVEMHCPGDPYNDRLLVITNDHVIRIRRFVDALITSLGPGSLPPADGSDEEQSPAVISYRVKR